MTSYFRDPTLAELLSDPLTRAVMRADGVTSSEFKTLLYSAANALRHAAPSNGTKAHAAKLLAAPKRRLLSMVHPLAVRSSGPCMAA